MTPTLTTPAAISPTEAAIRAAIEADGGRDPLNLLAWADVLEEKGKEAWGYRLLGENSRRPEEIGDEDDPLWTWWRDMPGCDPQSLLGEWLRDECGEWYQLFDTVVEAYEAAAESLHAAYPEGLP